MPTGWVGSGLSPIIHKDFIGCGYPQLTSCHLGLGVPQSCKVSPPAQGLPQDADVKESSLFSHQSWNLPLYLSIITYRWWLRQKSVCLQCGRPGFDSWVRKIPWRRNGNPLQHSCLENPMDGGAYSPWGRKESDTTEQLHFTMLKNDLSIKM